MEAREIVNAYTGEVTEDLVGSKAELKYYRVMIEGIKHYFSSEGQYTDWRMEQYGDDDIGRDEINDVWPRPLRRVDVENYRGPLET